MKRTILVTGPNGNIGSKVVEALRFQPVNLRLGLRNGSECGDFGACETVRLDFRAPSTFEAAVNDCESLFLLRPPAISNVQKTLNPLIDAARRAGVNHIVFISVAGADTNTRIPHYAVEEHLRAGPPDWTILRPGFFAQNFESAYRNDIVTDNRIYVPAGNGKVAFVDLRDIGSLTANILLRPDEHLGAAYTLTGPVASTFLEAAAWLSDALGRQISYQPATSPGYFFHLLRSGLTPMHSLVQTVLHVGLRHGDAERVDPILENLLGRKCYDLKGYIDDHANLWRC